MMASGSDLQPVFLGQFGQELCAPWRSRGQQRTVLGPEDDVLDHGDILDQLEVLVDQPDAGADRGLAVGDGGGWR